MTQDIKYQISRSTIGHYIEDETNDCTVRATSNAFQIPYVRAHAALEKFGRKKRKGCNFYAFLFEYRVTSFNLPKNCVFEGNFQGTHFSTWKRPRCTVKTFIRQHMSGSYILRIPGHVFAVIDGVLLDAFVPNLNARIQDYWIIGTPAAQVAAAKMVIKNPGIVKRILELHAAGFTRTQIVAQGFNKSTVYRQVREFQKRNLNQSI